VDRVEAIPRDVEPPHPEIPAEWSGSPHHLVCIFLESVGRERNHPGLMPESLLAIREKSSRRSRYFQDEGFGWSRLSRQ
jgi:hypothetical protein